MKHCAEQLACLTAIVLSATNVAEATDKGTDAQRKGTVAKVEACMQAGFKEYEYTKKERKEEFKISGKLNDKIRRKAPALIGGERSVSFIQPAASKIKSFHEVFVGSSSTGLIEQFSKDIKTKSGKEISKCFDGDEDVGPSADMVCNESCEAEQENSDDRGDCCGAVEVSKPNNCKVSEKTAQANYDYFLKEASDQCEERAKINSNFRQRLKAAMLQHRKKPSKN